MKGDKKKESNNGLMIHFSLITWTDAPGKENRQPNQISFEHDENKQCSFLEIQYSSLEFLSCLRIAYDKQLQSLQIYEAQVPRQTSCQVHNFMGIKMAMLHNLNPCVNYFIYQSEPNNVSPVQKKEKVGSHLKCKCLLINK